MTVQRQELSHPKYRPDIDGLRAIAVSSVVLFHAFPSLIRGGFVGVDIFFVISGYLISAIIFKNLESNSFSFSQFYTRRIKRIFPSLLTVLVAVFAFGWVALLADEYRQLGLHILAGAGFVSNLVLWHEAGYFDNSAATKPLLHLWSLGVEEQFYIVWPLLLCLAWRCRFNLLTITILIALASLVANLSEVGHDAVAAFYSPQTRFWEMLCGTLLAWSTLYAGATSYGVAKRADAWLIVAIYRDKRANDGSTLRNVLSMLGTALLIYSFWRINERLAFPGKWAVFPVVGAVCLIGAGVGACINRWILSNKILIWIGQISFPLYLWHWPLLSFARIIESGEPRLGIRIGAVVLAIVLAWVTYRLIERPLRFGAYGTVKVTVMVVLMMAIAYAGYDTYSRDGLAFRKHAVLKGYEGEIGHLAYHRYVAQKYYLCTPATIAKEALDWAGFVRCMQSKPGPDVDIALLGDSHAEHLFPGFAEALPQKNIVFYIKGGAPFLENPDFKDIFTTLIASKTIKYVILGEYWNYERPYIPAGSSLAAELIKVIDVLNKAGKRVYLTTDDPAFSFPPEKCKGKRWLASKAPSCDMSIENANGQRNGYIDALRKVVESRPDVKLLDVGKYFCNDKSCSMIRGDQILYRDTDHLNLNGSLYVGKRLVDDNPGLFN